MNPPRPKSPGKARGGTATIEMVAQAAGVSPSTVSRILNGTAKVHEDKITAVRRAIERLRFVPNPAARLLAMGRSMTIGVVTQSIDSPFYGEGLRGIEDVLGTTEFAVLFASGHWNPRTERKCVDHLLSRRVDGLIFLTTSLPAQVLREAAGEVPVVVTGRHVKGERIFCLEFDNEGGSRLATEHLIALGHRRIAYVAGLAGHTDATQRMRGYRLALEAAGIAFDPALVCEGQYREATGEAAVYELLDRRVPFTAIVAANDQSAYGAMLALYRRGLKIPQDVSLVGFDDLLQSAFTIPPLTSVHQAIYETGQMAARAIVDLIAQAEPNGNLPPPSLSLRESTRPCRGNGRA